MSLVIGVLMVAIAVVATTATALVCRRPNPPGWTKSFFLVEVVTVVAVALLAAGTTKAITFFLAEQPVFGAREAGLLALIVAVFWLAWWRMRVRATLRSYAAVTDALGPSAANLNPAPPPTVAPRTPGAGPGRRTRAA